MTPLEQLVRNHRAFLAFVERRVGNRAIAEDILQDAFGRAVERVDELREDESAVAWFYRMLRNAVIDRYRRGDAERRALEKFAREMDPVSPAQDIEHEICRCVNAAADNLKPEYAEALRKVDVESQPVKTFAAEHGITPTNASVRLLRARQALKKEVTRACGTCAEHGCVDCSCKRA